MTITNNPIKAANNVKDEAFKLVEADGAGTIDDMLGLLGVWVVPPTPLYMGGLPMALHNFRYIQ